MSSSRSNAAPSRSNAALVCILLVALSAATAILLITEAGPSIASTKQLSVLEDSGRVLSPIPAIREESLDEIKSLDADVVKIPVSWRSIAPNPTGRVKPSDDLTDPSSYPAVNWMTVDAAVLGAEIRGLKVWMMITAPAPRWAVASEPARGPGSLNPDPDDYAEFVEAVAKRYKSVKIWSIWNEPNLSLFLQPQFKKGVAVSAIHYRKMYRAAYAALIGNGHRRDTILFGELLPRAPLPRRANGTIPPVMWLREFFCLDDELLPYTGAEARAHGCNGFKPLKTSGFAYHPYTTPQGPRFDDPMPLNATINHLGRIYGVLDAASRQRRLSGSKLKIYSSEFGFQSNPPDRKTVPIRKIPEFLNFSELLSYNDRRMATYSQYQLVDDKLTTGFQSGLRFYSGRKKTDVYAAYQLPLVVIRRTTGTVTVWGKLRSSDASIQEIEIQVRAGSKFETVETVESTSSRGYFKLVLSTPGAGAKTYRLKAGKLISRSAKPVENPTYAP
ncbi:MAG: hypothetical protein WAP35_01020 [Solirubrobacterales bacterium]